MKKKFVIITAIGISIFLVFCFLITVTQPIGIMCHSKEPVQNEGSFGYVIRFTVFGYVEFLLNSWSLYDGNSVCTPE